MNNSCYSYETIKDTILEYIGQQTVSKYPSAEECRAARMGAEGVLYAIEDAPTVDAVEVVRCCECRHCEVVNNDITFAICKAPPKTLFLPFDIDTRTHFCSYGERKARE